MFAGKVVQEVNEGDAKLLGGGGFFPGGGFGGGGFFPGRQKVQKTMLVSARQQARFPWLTKCAGNHKVIPHVT